jgi:isochorismate pyruvate lyase
MTETTEPRVAPADCASMTEVRQGVDAIDRALVALLVERQGYMDAATRVKAEARRLGLSEAIAEPVWRTLVERSIAYEFEVWDRLRG